MQVHANGYDAVGANEGGRKWTVDFTPFSSPALLGFVVDGEARPKGAPQMRLVTQYPEDFVEPPLTDAERKVIRGVK